MTSPDPDAVTGGHAGGGHGCDRHGGRRAGGGGHAGSGGHGGPRGDGPRGGGHSALFLVVAGTLAVLLFVTFVVLGTWQLKRRVWKLDLIARVEQRVHAPPAAAPAPAQWSKVSAATDEYRHVTVSGTFLDESQILVQAVTELGAGYWVLTPLRTANGTIVVVNRGFIAADDRDRVARGAVPPRGAPNITARSAIGTVASGAPDAASGGASGAISGPAVETASAGADMSAPTIVTGLLRMSEPRGAFLRRNDAAANHWYSRDVQAIAAARGLTHVAPYFIDAEGVPPGNSAAGVKPAVPTAPSVRAASAVSGDACRPAPTTAAAASSVAAADAHVAEAHAGDAHGADANAVMRATCVAVPVGGLTVITFHNSHLVYAITWYTLALMVAGAIWLGIRSETRP